MRLGRGASRLRALVAATAITAGSALAVGGATAHAHVTVAPGEAPAEGYAMLDLSVPHGCEESPTTSISVQMPDQVVSATPQVVPGWTIETKEGKLPNPVESHGETLTTGVREVTWKGGVLDPHQLEVFGLSVRFAGEAGELAPFKVVQRCRQGESAWIEMAEDGGPEPEYPAPVVTLVAAEDSHDHSGSDASAHEDETGDRSAGQSEETSDDAAATAPAADGDDDGDGPLPVIALVIAVVALSMSIAGFARSRKAS